MSDLQAAAHRTTQRLINAGHTTYFAGGCVRDRLLGTSPKDYDIATSATPDEVQELFPRSNAIGAHFGVILVKEGKFPFEIATVLNFEIEPAIWQAICTNAGHLSQISAERILDEFTRILTSPPTRSRWTLRTRRHIPLHA